MINDLTVERCTYGRMEIRQTDAREHASRAFVRGIRVRQGAISASGARGGAACIHTSYIDVRLFGRMRVDWGQRDAQGVRGQKTLFFFYLWV